MIKRSKLFLSLFSMGLLITTCVPHSTLKYGYAQTFIFNTPFSEHEVSDFNSFNQLFFDYTTGSNNLIIYEISFDYVMSSAPVSSFPMSLVIRLSNSGASATTIASVPFNIPASTTGDSASVSFDFSPSTSFAYAFLNVIDDDPLFSRLVPRLQLINTPDWNGVTITLSNIRYRVGFSINYDTIYLFNHFLNDMRFAGFNNSGFTASGVSFNTRINYIYSNTLTTNVSYAVFNSDTTSIGTTRKRYAISIPNTNFIGNLLGIEMEAKMIAGTFTRVVSGFGSSILDYQMDLYYLNGASVTPPISPIPEFNISYEDCGGFFALNVPCFLNNGLAWIVNDAPLISDAIQLANSGLQFIGQGIGFIGAFVSSTNIFTWIIVAGFGLIIIKWVVTNDE